jgi:hypothetical protein
LALQQRCPLLDQDNWRETSGATNDYNCAAWAVNDQLGKWWPQPLDDGGEDYYWPEGARRDGTLEAFADGYGCLGFEVCDNADPEEGYEKIAIYATRRESPTHVARQVSHGKWKWTSKMGPDEDIEHVSLRDLQGGAYGYPRLFMRRRSGVVES